MIVFEVKTEKNNVNIEVYSDFISKERVKVGRELFSEMCKKGCKNYGMKYSCPPFSPSFEILTKDYDDLFVVMFLCRLNQIKSTEYNKIRIANSIMKSRIDKLMRNMESKIGAKYFSTGSCRLCKPCGCKEKKPCKHPDKMRYSLESTGVDCNALTKDLFGIKLQW